MEVNPVKYECELCYNDIKYLKGNLFSFLGKLLFWTFWRKTSFTPVSTILDNPCTFGLHILNEHNVTICLLLLVTITRNLEKILKFLEKFFFLFLELCLWIYSFTTTFITKYLWLTKLMIFWVLTSFEK